MSDFIRGEGLVEKRRRVIQMTQKYDSNKKKFSGKKRKGYEKLFNGNQMKFWHAHMGNF
jgi:hypothetical protein